MSLGAEKIVTFKAGDVVIEQGETDRRIFILREGVLEVRKSEMLVALVDTPTSIVGEMAVILEKPRSCAVLAKTDCELTVYEHGIEQIIRESPTLTKFILRELAERLEEMTDNYATVGNLLWSIEAHE